jgi:hypothetical protein
VSATQAAVQLSDLTSGYPVETLERLTWRGVMQAEGNFRMGLIQDLDRLDIRPDVRLNAAVLQRFRPGETTLTPRGLGDFRVTLTTEWQSVRARFANALAAAIYEDPQLGARTFDTEAVDNVGNHVAPPRSNPGAPGLFEFRMPCEAALIIAKK